MYSRYVPTFQHGNEKNAYDPYMGNTNGKELRLYAST